jgi:hypothetical protein
MIARLRLLLRDPLDPAVASVVTALGVAAAMGFALVVLLVGVGCDVSQPAGARVASAGPSRWRCWDRAPIGRVLGDLAEARYDAEWACLSAGEFGAPHLRKRVWITAYPCSSGTGLEEHRGRRQRRQSSGSPESALLRQEDGADRPEGAEAGGGGVADASRDTEARAASPTRSGRERTRKGGARSRAEETADPEGIRSGPRRSQRSGEAGSASRSRGRGGHWSTEPRVGRVADGVPDRVDRLAGLGNALVPEIARWIGQRIFAYEEQAAMTSRDARRPAGLRKPPAGPPARPPFDVEGGRDG